MSNDSKAMNDFLRGIRDGDAKKLPYNPDESEEYQRGFKIAYTMIMYIEKLDK